MLTTIAITIGGVIFSYLGGFITRWIVDFRIRRKEKVRLEAQYKLKLYEQTERIKQEYEAKINELKALSPEERIDWLAKHTS